ncbi:MAG TPA: alkaline phosphatase family protein [Candidatus Acidoferrum sp.]|nr:alkaline phosphatase family protein [Candidatus Acidoferrum sp.]
MSGGEAMLTMRLGALLSARAGRLIGAALGIALAAATSAFVGATPSLAATSPPHIMLIVMENEGYAQIIGNTQAPYINSLASTYTSATKWYGLQDSSIADYIALVSGTTGTHSAPTVIGELASASISWKAYLEDMPSVCYTGKGIGNYSKLHNPFVYFKSIRTTALCNQVVPFSPAFASDLSNNTAPDFMWVSPNECDDMNSKCSPLNNYIKQGDQWLQATIPTVLDSQWYAAGGTIIITWDSATKADQSGWNTGSGGHVPTIVISAKSSGTFSLGGNHYGTLRAIEEAYGIGLLGASATAANGDLTPAFG